MSKHLAIVMFILLGAVTVACLPLDTQSAVTAPEPAAAPAVEPQAELTTSLNNTAAETVAQTEPQLPTLPVEQGEEVPPINEDLQVTHGPMSGEVTNTAVTLWARSNVSGTLQFALVPAAEISLTETISDNFAAPIALATVETTAEADFTGEVRVDGLEPDSNYVYQVTLTDGESSSTAVYGQFATAPSSDTAAPLNFVFGGCLGGQGFCRTEEGWVIFDQMAAVEPDFFVMVGDGVYLDTACAAEGGIPGAEGPFNELNGFRTRYQYHLEDPIYANFLAQTPIFPTWDD
ncbi:MAG: PhoD-like phosphatase N-terminal domain-containing protein, partial [Anaerolineales bacterium]|nr:PhoD-like phosphatase N-terminal domain-containing protein [Anaerolineales bacterium]